MPSMQGRKVEVRVFLEGIEVDVLSVRVTGGVNEAGTAVIEIPPTDAVHRLLPRTLVHVFYFEGGSVWADPTNPDGKPSDSSGDPADPVNWRLLFAGEVLAYGYANAGGARQISLQCQDFSSYWQQARMYWGANNLANYGYKNAVLAGATQVYSGSTRVDSTDALLKLLLAKPTTIPRLTGLLGGVIALLEAATGVYHPNADKKFRGLNDFMSQAEIRLHLTHMIGAASNDDSSTKFLDTTQFSQYLRRSGRAMGATASFMDIVQLMMNRIYYQWSSVPAPPYFPYKEQEKVKTTVLVSKKTGNKVGPNVKGDLDAALRLFRICQARERVAINRQRDNSQGFDSLRYVRSIPPNSAELDTAGFSKFKSDSAFFTVQGNYWDERSVAVKKLIPATDQHALDRFPNTIGQAYTQMALAGARLHIMNSTPDGHNSVNLRYLRDALYAAILGFGGFTGGNQLVPEERDIALGDRLNCHLFTPDLYMAPPPTCNVLFPDQYVSIRFSRDWMSEVTRLIMHTKTASGQDVKDIYFAPTTDILNSPSPLAISEAIKQGISFQMKHERYTGIIAALEGIGDTSIFKKILEKSQAEVGKKKPDGQAPTTMSHLRQAANYLFFSKRFGSRSMDVQARFCPNPVVGLPMLVLDPISQARSQFGNVTDTKLQPTGTHYIGTVARVVHHIDARGSASSSFQLVKCREHREVLDLSDDGQYTDTVTKTEAVSGGTIKGVQRFSKTRNANLSREKVQTDAAKGHFNWQADPTALVYLPDGKPVTVKQDQDIWATGDATFDGDAVTLPVAVRSKPTTKTLPPTSVTFPIEAAAMPPWLASCFYPALIGKEFYQKMLGCGSILDTTPLHLTGDQPQEIKKLELQIKAVDGSTQSIAIPPSLVSAPLSVVDACDKLAESWKGLTENQANVALITDQYTSRAFATVTDIMGNKNPYLRWRAGTPDMLANQKNRHDVVGFHGNAYGRMVDLKDIDGNSMMEEALPKAVAPANNKSTYAPVSTANDPRKERRSRVWRYRMELIGTPTPNTED